jgi:hypothetical protein
MVSARRGHAGSVLIGAVFLAFVVSVTLMALARLWEADAQRDKERELLWAGRQIGKALASYALATPEGEATAPRSLDPLLLDARVDPPVRHLRRLPLDPMTGTFAWGIVRAADGTVVAVHSTSRAKPLAPDGLWPEVRAFAAAKAYSQWVFGPVPMHAIPRVAPEQAPP